MLKLYLNVIKEKKENADDSVMNTEKKSINLAVKRSTEWKNNKRINVIAVEDDDREIRNNFIKHELLGVAKAYIENNCTKSGEVKENNNLSKQQRKSLKSLKEKRKLGVIVGETDKTSKFCVNTVKNMEVKMQKHIQNDKVMTPADVTKVENKLNSHASRLIKVFSIGEKVKQTRRTVSNLVTKNNPIPIIHGTSKDHKPVADPNIGPEIRPIMGASVGPNTGLAQIGCEFLKAILANYPNPGEVKSTEEMLNAFSVYNDSREQCLTNPTLESKLPRKVIGSMDIKSFYPSVKPEKVALVVRHMWNKSNIKVDNVDIDGKSGMDGV